MFESYKRVTNAIVNLVNRTGASGNRAVSTFASKNAQEKFLSAAHRCAAYNLALGSYSEMSVQLNKTHYLTLKKGTPLAEARAEDLVVLSLAAAGDLPDYSPRQAALHKLVYAQSEYDALLFCHPRYTSLWLGSDRQPDFAFLPELKPLAGEISVCSQSDLEAHLRSSKIVYIQGLGLLSLGRTPLEALEGASYLEWICWQNFHAFGITAEND